MANMSEGGSILVTSGTGSLGQALVRRLLSTEQGTPTEVRVLARHEVATTRRRAALGREPRSRRYTAHRPLAGQQSLRGSGRLAPLAVVGDAG